MTDPSAWTIVLGSGGMLGALVALVVAAFNARNGRLQARETEELKGKQQSAVELMKGHINQQLELQKSEITKNLRDQEARLRTEGEIRLKLHAQALQILVDTRRAVVRLDISVSDLLWRAHSRGLPNFDDITSLGEKAKAALIDAMSSAVLVPEPHRSQILPFIDALRTALYDVEHEALSRPGGNIDVTNIADGLTSPNELAVRGFDAWAKELWDTSHGPLGTLPTSTSAKEG